MTTHIPVSHGISLTEIRKTDVDDYVNLLNDKDIYDNTLMIPFPYKKGDAEKFIESSIKAMELAKGISNWAIRLHHTRLIGGVGIDVKGHKGEIGYWLGKPYWGKGIMTNTVLAATDYFFGQFGLTRIEAIIFAGNTASSRVLEKAGFMREGYLRKYYFKDDKYIDGILFSKLN